MPSFVQNARTKEVPMSGKRRDRSVKKTPLTRSVGIVKTTPARIPKTKATNRRTGSDRCNSKEKYPVEKAPMARKNGSPKLM